MAGTYYRELRRCAWTDADIMAVADELLGCLVARLHEHRANKKIPEEGKEELPVHATTVLGKRANCGGEPGVCSGKPSHTTWTRIRSSSAPSMPRWQADAGAPLGEEPRLQPLSFLRDGSLCGQGRFGGGSRPEECPPVARHRAERRACLRTDGIGVSSFALERRPRVTCLHPGRPGKPPKRIVVATGG